MNFEVRVLSEAYENWHQPGVQDLFISAISLKSKGYSNRYPNGVLPIDTTEFVGTHVLLFDKDQNKPVMGFRSLTQKCCERHFIDFPLLTIARRSQSAPHIEAVESILSEAKRTNLVMHYNGGWTMDPAYRKTPEIISQLKELMIGLDYLYHQEIDSRSEILGAGVCRFKTDLFFKSYGYDFMKYQAEELPTVLSKYLGDEEIRFLHVKSFNQTAINAAKNYEGLWNNRIELGEGLTVDRKVAA